ncbi:alpha-glucosidase [Candidatus Bipolaricaulota bacterium]|nr:alpha-glucosidase [Candidatus Bipolaricaulota bacterium]
MSSSNKADYDLEFQGIDPQISKLNMDVFPETDYENELIPPLEIEETEGQSNWDLRGSSTNFQVEGFGDCVAEFEDLKAGSPSWVRDDWSKERQCLQLVHVVGTGSRVFGLGEKTGYLEKSGREYEMWNRDPNGFYTHNEDPLYSSTPFYIVQRENGEREFVGVYLHQAERSKFRVKSGEHEDGIGIAVAAPEATLYLIYGEGIKEVVKGFTRLTGKPLLPPRWALGYHHSKYGVPRNQEEALNLAEEFRERRLPCDTIYFDIQHMDENKDFTWDRDRFPDPEGLIDKLHDMNYRVVNIVDPGIKEEKGYEVYESGRENDVFVKDEDGDDFSGSVWPGFCSFPDFIREGVRDWWADQNEKLLAQGVDGIWNDMNEPAVFFGKKQLREVADSVDEEVEDGGHLDYEFKFDLRNLSDAASEDMVHHNETGEEVDHGKVHNLYGYYEALATRKAFENKRPDQRPFILTRAGFAGMQKYVAKWTGDNSSTWEHMKMSIYMALNLGLSGVPFVGPDIGGFSGDVESELLTRWIQLGSVFPFYRNHSGLGTVSQEPWSFGDENEEINRKYMSLRYQLLPYLYTEFYRTHETGLPILRPLFMEFSDDEETYSVTDQFMVGESILVAPVVERNSDKRLLYLPHGDNGEELDWKSWWSGEFLTSGYHLVKAPLDVMPMYIRPGHGVPFTETVQYTGEIPELLKLAVNKGQDGGVEVEIPVYHDDGETKDWQDGKFFYGSFLVEEVDGDLKLDLKVEKDGIDPFWEEVQVR